MNSSAIIDHVATTCAGNITKSGVHEVSLSDHFVFYCVRKLNGAVKKDHKVIKNPNMIDFNEEAYLADVPGMCGEQMLKETDDINALVNNWSNLLSLVIDKHAPIAEVRVSEKFCPWIDKDLRNLMVARDRLKKAATKRKSLALMDSYRQVRNRVHALNVRLKKEYYTHKITACAGNIKESWKTINLLLNKRSKSSNIDCLKDSDSETVCKKEISNKMNTFFCSVGKDLADRIDPVSNPFLSGHYKVNPDKADFH